MANCKVDAIEGIGPVGEEYSQLLECTGVDTVKDLATHNAENLAAKLAEVNGQKKLTRRVPPASGVAAWVEQAKSLPTKVTHTT